MQPQFLRELKSSIDTTRYAAWQSLPDQPEALGGVLALAHRRELCQLLSEEEVPEIQMFALIQLAALGFPTDLCLPAPSSPSVQLPPRVESRQNLSVDDWFGQLFDRPSALFGITEKDYFRRDEDALIHLARRFPFRTYPQLETRRVLHQSDDWEDLLMERDYQTMLFVGRLWLYGRNAVQQLAGENLHFDFPNNTRPPGLPRDRLDASYHAVRQRSDGEDPVQHIAQEQDGRRTDYGLVQVYTAHVRHPRTIVQCAGTSSLGTMGAAMWLTYDVARPLEELGGNPIPLPPGGATKHRMEALLRVNAETTTCAWQPKSIQLCALHIDDFFWSPYDLQWRRSVAPHVELHMRGRTPSSIYINGRPSTLKPGSQNYRLAVAVIDGISRSTHGAIRVCTLGENSDIWDQKQLESKVVKQRLHTLNQKQLEGILAIGDEVRINAKIDIVNDDDAHGGSHAISV